VCHVGDTHISLAQRLNISGAVVVTTPQEVALSDVRRSIEMFRKVNVPLLGIVENMSYYVCDCCGHEAHIFGRGGGLTLAKESQSSVLGRLPLDPAAMQGGELGAPVCVTHPSSRISKEYVEIARQIWHQIKCKV
jgi:ATP-binding protein involved in chromosome partitioning